MSVLTRPPAAPAGQTPAAAPAERRSALVWAGVAIAAICLGVALISVFAPDNVSGTEQEHVAIAAILTWIWGLLATRTVLVTVLRRLTIAGVGFRARVLAAVVVPAWLAATLVALFVPVLVTGTDPTRTPLAAIIAPIAAMVLTQVAAQTVRALQGDGER